MSISLEPRAIDANWSKVGNEVLWEILGHYRGRQYSNYAATISLTLDIKKHGRIMSLSYYERLWHWGFRRVKAFILAEIGRLKALLVKALRPNRGDEPIKSAKSSEPIKVLSSTTANRTNRDIYSSATIGRYQPNISPSQLEAMNREWEEWEAKQREYKERLEANPEEKRRLWERAMGRL